jgi:hypothetical protein
MCEAHGAIPEYADETESGELIPRNRSSATTITRTRFLFPDGSAIVIAGDAWDIEGDTPFSWLGA